MLGVFLLHLIGFYVLFALAGSLGSGAGSAVTEVPSNAVLNIDMSTMVVAEQTRESNPFENLTPLGSNVEISVVGLLDAIRALEEAASDPSIKCVYLRPDAASDISHLEEFRAAICEFRKSGKPVCAYIQVPTNAGYYLASAADRIYMSAYHGGMNNMIGLSGTMLYYKDLLDKLGINVQLIRHGKYKSAGEPYIRSTASAENLEQQRVMISGIWNEMVGAMVQKSGMPAEKFNQLIDNLELKDAQCFLDNGLVDELVTMDGMKEKLCTLVGVEKYSQVKSIRLSDYAKLRVKDNYKVKDGIAVIYADGEIIDGRDVENVAGKRFADIINEVRENDSVKGVVLRVNSPGGSVVAASEIKDAVDALCAEKPVVASYGSYAASGGYWISANCNYIFSDATTLTGSIGVFGIIPEFGKTVRNLAHLNVYSVNSNKHADMYSFMRPLSQEELDFVQYDIESIYTQFTTLVAEGRKMEVSRVDELGQGRVWTGRDALANGLVDQIGGLKEAIEYCALQCGTAQYRVMSYPQPLTFMETLMLSMQPSAEDYLVEGFGVSKNTLATIKSISSLKSATVYARLPYMMEIK